MNAEASFNHNNEPCVNLFPENEEEVRLLTIMSHKSKGIEGNHLLICGLMHVNGELECATVVTNQIGHPTTIRES